MEEQEKMSIEMRQDLFNHLSKEHDLILLESELDFIIMIVGESLSKTIHAKRVSDEDIEEEFPVIHPCIDMKDIQDALINRSKRIGAHWMQDRLSQTTEGEDKIHHLDLLDYKRFREMQNMSLKMDRKDFSEYLRDNWVIIRVVKLPTDKKEKGGNQYGIDSDATM